MSETFDPFETRRNLEPSILDKVEQREIYNIIQSYHGNYDLFIELLQNAVDAVETRWSQSKTAGDPYVPRIWVYLDFDENSVAVLDNGIGMNEEKFRLAFAPQVTFKSGDERGCKGVGLSYLAYGFESILLATKESAGSEPRIGYMARGRDWAEGIGGVTKPVVDKNPRYQSELPLEFVTVNKGTLVRVRCGNRTRPKNLRFIARDLGAWETILRTKTAIGIINILGDEEVEQFKSSLQVLIKSVDNGITSPFRRVTPEYIFPHTVTGISSLDYDAWHSRRFPNIHLIRPRDKNKDAVFKFWDKNQTRDLYESSIGRTEENDSTVNMTEPRTYGFYTYSTKVFRDINDRIGLPNRTWLQCGLHIASRNMIQCNPLEISLTRRIGDQRVMHILIEFDNIEPDLGRKSLQREIVDVAQIIARRVHQYFLDKREFLKVSRELPTGDELVLEEWQNTIHSRELTPENALPEGILMSSSTGKEVVQKLLPLEEQEVIVLFIQLCSLSVLKGYKILASATSGKPYDSLFRVELNQDDLLPATDRKSVLNIPTSLFGPDRLYRTRTSRLEFKHDLRDLVRDFSQKDKQFSQVDLAVAWQSSFSELEEYSLETVLEEGQAYRKYFGTTHVLSSSENREHQIEVILLRNLIEFLSSV